MKLSVTQRDELDRLEATIETGLRTFYEVGAALLRIRDGRLYLETHETFEEYCRERWEMTRSRAFRLIGASDVVRNLSAIGDYLQKQFKEKDDGMLPIGNTGQLLPSNEAQARPMTELETAELQQEAWLRAMETAPDGKVTAIHVARVVKDLKGERKEDKKTKDARRIVLINAMDESLLKAYQRYVFELMRARGQKWTQTPLEAAREGVRNIKNLVRS